ncbi:MAG: sigma-70 family RNA polymerase sigma factor [Clostridia bacterium]|nr:sigma-70 family RNA polymerase sigma factor [Clostridia bacterium]
MEDRNIISLFFERDEQAISETQLKYGKLILKISQNILLNSEDSFECVNDTYLALWNTIPPNRPDPFISFVCKIARNLSLKKKRDKNAMKRNACILPIEELENALFSGDVYESYSEKELGKKIDNFLSNISKEDRVVFIRRYWLGEEISEISDETGLSANSVYKRLSKTRHKLRLHLEEEGFYL